LGVTSVDAGVDVGAVTGDLAMPGAPPPTGAQENRLHGQSVRGVRGPPRAECDQTIRMAAFPFGCHVCEVEIVVMDHLRVCGCRRSWRQARPAPVRRF